MLRLTRIVFIWWGVLICLSQIGCIPIGAQHTYQIEEHPRLLQPSVVFPLPEKFPEWVDSKSIWFSPDGNSVLTSEPPVLWDSHSGQQKRRLAPTTQHVSSPVWSKSGKWIAASSWYGYEPPYKEPMQFSIHIWNVETGSDQEIELGSHRPELIAFSPDESMLKWVSFRWQLMQDGEGQPFDGGRSIRVDAEVPKGTKPVPSPSSYAPDLSKLDRSRQIGGMWVSVFSPDGRYGYGTDRRYAFNVLNNSFGGLMMYFARLSEGTVPDPDALYQIDLHTGKRVAKWNFGGLLEWPGTSVSAISPNGKTLVVNTWNRTLLIDLTTRRSLGYLHCENAQFGDQQNVDSVTFSPDGKRIAGGPRYGYCACIWDVRQNP